MSSSKILLLDVDGVLLRKQRILTHVSHHVIRYVQRYVPKAPDAQPWTQSVLEAYDLNQFLYTHYGHTHRGLKGLYGKKVPDLAHFNKHVYDQELLSALWTLKDDPEVRRHAVECSELLHFAERHGIPVYLFSNAPNLWCESVVQMMGLSKMLPEDHILGSSHPLFDEELLKPDLTLYDKTSLFLQTMTRNAEADVVLVDDSMTNLLPVLGVPGWTPVLFHPKTKVSLGASHLRVAHELVNVPSVLC